MSEYNDGGPAFPIDESQHAEQVEAGCNTITVWTMGMSMRDYFAAKAMAAYVSSDAWREDMNAAATAHSAYRMADAMLEERK